MLRSGRKGVGPLARLTPGACRPAFEPQDERQSLPAGAQSMPHKKFSRNAPCPCGSGKTYESCCYVKAVEWVEDEDGTVYKSMPMSPDVQEALERLRQAFVARHGREPGPDDLLFPDLPHPEHLEAMMVEDMEGASRFHLPFPERRDSRHRREPALDPGERPGWVGYLHRGVREEARTNRIIHPVWEKVAHDCATLVVGPRLRRAEASPVSPMPQGEHGPRRPHARPAPSC